MPLIVKPEAMLWLIYIQYVSIYLPLEISKLQCFIISKILCYTFDSYDHKQTKQTLNGADMPHHSPHEGLICQYVCS